MRKPPDKEISAVKTRSGASSKTTGKGRGSSRKLTQRKPPAQTISAFSVSACSKVAKAASITPATIAPSVRVGLRGGKSCPRTRPIVCASIKPATMACDRIIAPCSCAGPSNIAINAKSGSSSTNSAAQRRSINSFSTSSWILRASRAALPSPNRKALSAPGVPSLGCARETDALRRMMSAVVMGHPAMIFTSMAKRR